MDSKEKGPDFYLSSDEYDLFEDFRKCYILSHIHSTEVPDLHILHIRIVPPIPSGSVKGTKEQINEIALTTRHEGDSLIPITDWPVNCHVLLPVLMGVEYRAPRVETKELGTLYSCVWAEVYPTEEWARAKTRRPPSGHEPV